ncbi:MULTISPECIES: arginine N-succinyltransferase [Hydrocarboniphaga]|uniref:Arginine N-succinyltransferase n=1 Tax=Hydrocarboniphaga effusa AP103 TaxID=1172194 RepID=I7Z9W8_9GAMM|nr:MULTISPECIES: arginine N-succinyltransferase [Hydrocarboniphaga]EIT68639.1 arginine N-succinyltransferase [Hydrocarboniphaga effusa AP103]MDZ4076840.1 arginine N-succinyltransferase [Hydrocarboniphaga sp.]
MKLIRPIRPDDLDDLVHMAQTAGAGFTSLPPDKDFLAKKIALSVQSFDTDVKTAGHERYMFVLEDSNTGEIGGCCAIEAACGLDEPFYNYHVGVTVHANRELGVYNRIPTLHLSNDYTATSVLCSLYLRPEFRSGGAGRLLSKCRFLFMGNFPARFSEKVIAEMRGVSDEKGQSPFWEGLGRHFFSIDYEAAEHIVGMGNKAFIAELMPPHPIYSVLLPPEAQAVMGRVHPQTAPALHLLEQEGFRYQNYVDIFDGGPTVEAPLMDIRSIRKSQLLPCQITDASSGNTHLIANDRLHGFRCALAQLTPGENSVSISAELAQALGVQARESVRVVAL